MDEFLNSTKGKITVITIAILLGMTWVSRTFLFGPLGKNIRVAKSTVDNVDQKRSLIATIQHLEKVLDGNLDNLSQTDDISKLIDDVNVLAGEAGIFLNSVDPRPTTVLGSFFEVPIHVAGYGTFHELGEFSSRIESMKPVLKIDEVSISGIPNTKIPGKTLSFVMTVSAVYRGE